MTSLHYTRFYATSGWGPDVAWHRVQR